MLWLVFEGPDKSGKTSLSSHVARYFSRLVLPVLVTREPGSEHDPICRRLRSVILSDATDDQTELLLFTADRIQHENKVVLPAIDSGPGLILQDRGVLSTFVYQVLDCKDEAERSSRRALLTGLMRGRRRPDLCVVCLASSEAVDFRTQNAEMNRLDLRRVEGIYSEVVDDLASIDLPIADEIMVQTLSDWGDTEKAVQQIAVWVENALTAREATRSPSQAP